MEDPIVKMLLPPRTGLLETVSIMIQKICIYHTGNYYDFI